MVWNARDEFWKNGYAHAVEFYEAYGHLKIPQGYISPDGYTLSNWLVGIKKKQKDGKLSADQLEQLQRKLQALELAVQSGNDVLVREALHQAVPTFCETESANNAVIV